MKIKNIGKANIVANIHGQQKVIKSQEVVNITDNEWKRLQEYPNLTDASKIFGKEEKNSEGQSKKEHKKLECENQELKIYNFKLHSIRCLYSIHKV